LALIGLSALLAAGCGPSEGKTEVAGPPPERVVAVSVQTVQPGPMKDVLILPGETRPSEDVRLAADQSGQVEWIGPREGQAVKKGELLAKIEVFSLKAALDNAEAAFKLSDELYRRRQRLFERKIISREELDQSETDRAVKMGGVRQARVQYEQGFLRSPLDGRVNYLHVDPGEYVSRGNPVLDLVNIDRIEIDVNVPEMDVRYLKPGQPVMLRVDALGEEVFQGSIDFVAYKADSTTKTFRIKVMVDNPDHRIRPGMIARVAFLRRVVPDALAAPLFAIVDKGGERVLFVEDNGVARSRTISIGVIEKDRVQITKGLESGDRLIVSGQKMVEDGIKVKAQ